ncbi:hypothetical protein VNO78_18506 [Psophocarpus tetragonolobus]|uniref:C2 domain-containing protein n=1 Tax=Psophocarpus tetragonolobus TaxID=3891 RepID=A0AAN9SIJ0_PSOTE
MSAVAPPYQLLEINVISAQDLAEVAKTVRAYAVAWVNPERKLATQVDNEGHTNPTWNEKFVFRVDDHFLNSDNSVIMMEIYCEARLRHVQMGSVAVMVSNLLPPNRKQKLRFVGLQIWGPSGRPQGILNIGVTLLDTTMQSMPLYSDLSSSAVSYWEPVPSNKNTTSYLHKHSPLDSTRFALQRCQSEKNDSTINGYGYHDHDQDSDVAVPKGGVFNEGSLISDVGPSPSVVAAAIAKGLYLMPPPAPRTADSSTIDGWSENTGTAEMKIKMERWRMELTPAYEDERKTLRHTAGQTPRRRGRPGGPCSCFGSVFGLEVSITCGRGSGRKGHRGGKSHQTTASSSVLTYGDSYI